VEVPSQDPRFHTPPVERETVDARGLEHDLRAAVEGEVRFSAGDRALYSATGANYRHIPIGIVLPRTLDDVDVWWFAKTSLADRRAEAIEPIKMALAASANHAFRFTLEGKGVPPDLHEKIRALQREYDSHHHELPGAANASLPDRWDLTDFLVDRFAIAGTPADCVAQVERAVEAGARQFLITGFVPDPRAFVRRWMREVAGRVTV
jgi:alkanesulfonate monooxygenase SsuD/methylene tetrahydromethanopterin reductase-like flavin-dependent oxidoreductase (luciferase family)